MATVISFPVKTPLGYILLLRAASIVIQAALVVFVNVVLDYQLPWQAISTIILAEALFNGISYWFLPRVKPDAPWVLAGHLTADIIFLTALLYFSGGATNAFVSLLLIPIAIAAVTLPVFYMLVIALQAVAVYSVLLWLMPMHVMHGNMQGHFIGMWINFLFSAVVVLFVVSKMAKAISDKTLEIARYREKQLKQEQIIALGVASAQVTHDLATPIASIGLLVDELEEFSQGHDEQLMSDLKGQVSRCRDKLHQFRLHSQEIKRGQTYQLTAQELVSQLKQTCLLNYPEIKFNFSLQPSVEKSAFVLTDGGLIPALINIVDNAVNATLKNKQDTISIKAEHNAGQLILIIEDSGQGFSREAIKHKGLYKQNSETGLGVALLLSNATIERLGGKIMLVNQDNESLGACVNIVLPLIEAIEQRSGRNDD